MGKTSYCELRRKEVVNMCTGAILGPVCDIEIDLATGRICAIVVPGPPRFFGLIKSPDELVIPFSRIQKIGDDVIIVDVVI